MKPKNKRVNKKPEGISDYLKLYKNLKKKSKNSLGKKIKIALLSSSTINGIKETLCVQCYQLGIFPEFYVGNYDQYSQEILDANSKLYKFKPDLVILSIDTRSIFGDYYLLPYDMDDNGRKKFVENKVKETTSLIKNLQKKSGSRLILHNFEVPSFSPLGILENKQKFGFHESIRHLNSELEKIFKENSSVFVFDYDNFCSKIGKNNMIDHKMYYLGDIKLDMQKIPLLCEEYLSYIKPVLSMSKKCIVLDLDNTLWGGIVGEDGIEGIKLGNTPEGRSFSDFQKYLLSLFNRGIILAINSKNNYEDAIEVFRKHPDMILKEENFASIKINWENKISNMKSIAEEINIGLDSIVFFDDDPINREMMKKSIPEIKVVDLPQDPASYLQTLMSIQDFETLQITKEDKNKGKMYSQQRKRTELKKSTPHIEDYLKNLGIKVTIQKANKFNVPRIAQLTQKTNQFNMTTKRYSDNDIQKLSKNKNYIIFSVRVEDNFGDNGISGVAIVDTKKCKIDNFLLSCRVIGRNIEEVMLNYIIKNTKKFGSKTLFAEFIPTKKNEVAKDFYKKNGFRLKTKDKKKETWEFSLNHTYKSPKFIEVIEE
ncbi:HAD family hydrolase [Candidatus Woesearchaeota archaeon]|nr:HAD family hydrolase [Candidatus Woesearchaeota archaeon]